MSSRAEKEQRKRNLIAIGAALLIHLAIVAAFLISHFVFPADVEEYRGPVLVKLGRADAPDEETDRQPSLPENREDEQISTETDEIETTGEVKTGEPGERVSADESESETAADRIVSETDNGDRGDSESSREKSAETSSTATEETSAIESEETINVTKGSEEGNAYETTYDASPGLVGRNFGVPIYMYMPLPQFFDKAIFDSIIGDENLADRPGKRTAESKKEFLLDYYELMGDEYYLQNPPSIDERPNFWSILEDGGYNLKNAEYKEGKHLNPVVLIFKVNVVSKEDSESLEGKSLSDVHIKSSSGYKEIDDAVLYGFLKASFYNSSDIPVKGRFTYRFD